MFYKFVKVLLNIIEMIFIPSLGKDLLQINYHKYIRFFNRYFIYFIIIFSLMA